MYTKMIPFKDFNGKPRNQKLELNLEVREVVKLLVEFQSIFKWLDSNTGPDHEERELSTEEVVEFYNNLEKILLESWGKMSEDGLYFHKTERYLFEESKLFAATMEMFVSEPSEATKMVDGLMPKGMEELVRKSEGNLENLKNDPGTSDQLRAEVERLQTQLREHDKQQAE